MSLYWTAEGMLGAVYFLCCICIVTYRTEIIKKFQPIDMTVLTMGVVYGLMFPLVVHGGSRSHRFIDNSLDYIYLHTTAAFVGTLGLLIGWQAVSSYRHHRLGTFFSYVNCRALVKWLYVMLICAFITQYLYTYDYGGFINYFEYNVLIRSGILPDYERSQFSFLAPFRNFTVLACIGFWGLMLSKQHRPIIIVGFALSTIGASYALYSAYGRVGMATFVAIFPVSLLLKYRVNYLIWFGGYFILALLGVVFIYLISNILGIKGSDSIREYIAREASFPFVSFFANLNEGSHFYLFRDIILAPMYLLPSSMINISDASVINTTIIEGAPKGTLGVTGSIPTDMLTFGLMQFHFPGIFIYSVLLGYIIRIAFIVANSFRVEGMRCAAVAYVMIKISIFTVFYAYPKHIIMTHFCIIATLLAMTALRVVRGTFVRA